MRAKNLTTKSDAIRQALREAAAQDVGATDVDFRSWLGQALRVPLRRRRLFRNEYELWSQTPQLWWPSFSMSGTGPGRPINCVRMAGAYA